ncbi:solute carrier family 35 member F2 isoform X4 [Hippopotamus amphibius kiboko]|uniref:solute carrier family 35 member F2 isoform X4 n=1 Tax=Hippopotamus amphibius kiboko TaxID=575201 RepID=UPI002592AE69|nr:solute carrier family 35 member F2 isoform X4 [Hippopotamus amphibius kiboko]
MEAASPAGPGGPQPHAPGVVGASFSLLRRIRGKLFTWDILKTVALGQMLSLCICGTAVTSQYLAARYKVNTPMLQSFINYCLLFLIYTVMLAFQSGSDNLFYILKKKWWKYILLGLADVEANYLIVRAYQYTTLTSVQLLDCFGIPVLMALSWFILYARYRVVHFIAVAVCLLGVGTMVGADILAGREDNSALLFVAFALCMFCLYSFMPLVIKVTSATSVNLGILTADLYSLFFGLFLFGYKILDPKIKPSHLLDKNFFGHSLQANSIFQDSTSCPSLSSWWGSFCTAPPRRAQQSWLKAACHQSPALESTTWD